MRIFLVVPLLIIWSCNQTKVASKKVTNTDNNNRVIVNSKNTIHNSTGNDEIKFEGNDNLIEISYDSSNYQGKNKNGLTIVKGNQNNIQVLQHKVIDLSENRNDTTIIVANGQKIKLAGTNIIDTSKNESEKNLLAQKSTDNDLSGILISKSIKNDNGSFIFLETKLDEDSLEYFSDTALIQIEEKTSPIKARDAFNFYMNEIRNGNAKAYYRIAIFFQAGIGTKVNSLKAEQYFEIAARKGIPEAQFSLGYIYESGFWKILPNKEKAIYYYKLAASQGYKDAQDRLDEIVQ